jgi:hypothetical protein
MRSVLPGLELAIGAPPTLIGLWLLVTGLVWHTGLAFGGLAILFAGVVFVAASIGGLIWIRGADRRQADSGRTG